MKFIKQKILTPILDILFLPAVFFSAIIMLILRKTGFKVFKMCKKVLLKVGIMPICNHYYEPIFDERSLSNPLSKNRKLPGIDWNEKGQLDLIKKFHYEKELEKFPDEYVGDTSFHFKNDAFSYGDAEYLYSLIRFKKPERIIEIGSGHSTKIAAVAVRRNKEENKKYTCEHICIEPYEMPWLEELDVKVIRKKVENVNKQIFKKLGKDDLLFIDSSHVIRPQGDVLYEYLELLPTLKKGVIVHVHDIFSPDDYPKEWLFDNIRLWNEQYLLEAFLTLNSDWKVMAALNFLCKKHYKEMQKKFPKLKYKRNPGSFYIVKKD
jgi:hypothetical protein